MKQNICAFSHSNHPTDTSDVRDDSLKFEIEELKDAMKKEKIENDDRIKSLQNEMKVQRELTEKIVAENQDLHKLLKVEIKDKFKHSEEYLEEKINSKLVRENKKLFEILKETQQKSIDKALKDAFSDSEVQKDEQTNQKNSTNLTEIGEPDKAKNKVKPKKITKEDKEKKVIA